MKRFITFYFLAVSFSIHAADITHYSSPGTVTGFVKNCGQFNEGSQNDVLFVYAAKDFKLVLRKGGFSYQLETTVPVKSQPYESGYEVQNPDDDDYEPEYKLITAQVKVDFVNPQQDIETEGENALPAFYNYYTNVCRASHVPIFKEVYYREVYRHIDLHFYFKENRHGQTLLTYDWIINPGGNAASISLAYSGGKSIHTNNDGTVRIENEIGFISEAAPVIVDENNNEIANVSYKQQGNRISYQSPSFRKLDHFTIDPVISWGLDMGGNKADLPDDIVVDDFENVYITGRTHSNKLWLHGQKIANHSLTDETDAFVAKFDQDGNLKWCTYYGGDGAEKPFAITLDPKTQEPYIGGKTGSSSGVAFNAGNDTVDYTIDSTYGGAFDAFLAKFTTSGDIIRSVYVGGVEQEYILGVACYQEPTGAVVVYASGTAESSVGIVRPSYTNVEQYVYSGGDKYHGDIMLLKFNEDLSERKWGTYYGNQFGQERSHELTIDYRGYIYVVGTMTEAFESLAKGNVFQTIKGGSGDAFLSQWNSTGTLNWLTFYGGGEYERGRDVKTDLLGNIYFCGKTTASTNTNYPNAMVSSASVIKPATTIATPDLDGFVAKFNDVGQRIWGTYFGGTNYDEVRALSVSPLGTPVYISGYTTSPDMPVTGDAYDDQLNSGDYFFAKLNYDATELVYSTFYGGSGKEGGVGTEFPDWYNGIIDVAFPSGNIYCSSGTSSNCSIEPDCLCKDNCDSTGYGDFDAFVVKFNDPCTIHADPFEPNDTASLMTAPILPFLPINKIICTASILPDSIAVEDLDYYGFKIPYGFNHLTITLDPANPAYDLTLKDWNGTTMKAGTGDQTLEQEVIETKNYYVSVADSEWLPPDSMCYTVQIGISYIGVKTASGISNDLSQLKISVQPNPAQQIAVLNILNAESGTYKIAITDLSGNVLQESAHQLVAGNRNIMLNVAHLAAGCYFIKVSAPQSGQNVKLVIAR